MVLAIGARNLIPTSPLRLLALLAIASGAACLAGCGGSPSLDVAADERQDTARAAERLVALFDYVASDYAGAVKDGAIVSESEYAEQLHLVEDMRRLAAELSAPIAPHLDALEALIAAKAPATSVAEACGKLRRDIVTRYSVAVAPSTAPSLDRAELLYRQRCVECHGPDGRADTPSAKLLKPPPASLLDPERMAGVTPYRAYCAITYGIENTAMAGHGIPSSDRWSLAFYAVSLRHREAAQAATGTARHETLGLATLANETDAGLDATLAGRIPEAPTRAREIAWQRAVAPFERGARESPLALARRLFTQARERAIAGDRAEADSLVIDGYLRGIEEVEAPLRAIDGGLVLEIEGAKDGLRAAIRGAARSEIEAAAARVLARIDDAERLLDRSVASNAFLAFAGAMLVLREGLEAALIVAAVLAVVKRTGTKAAVRAVHAGWSSALVAGFLTFFIARTIVSSLVMQRELIEGVVSLLAAVVLFLTSFWLISKADAKRWIAYLKSRAAGSATGGSALGLASVAFLAVYREAFESVLFFEALVGGDRAHLPPVVGGAAAGAVLLAIAVYAIIQLEQRLPIGPFFAVSGAALSGLSVVLVGHGVHALQATSWLVPRPVDLPTVELLGIFPDAIGLATQGVVLAAIVGSSLWFKIHGGAAPAGGAQVAKN